MDLLEHQGKGLFASAGLATPPSRCVVTGAEAQKAAAQIGLPVIVKAQVRAGGRGKAGAVRRCETTGDVVSAAADVLGMTIAGRSVSAVLVEKAVDIEREMYIAVSLSRPHRGPVLIFSKQGGIDIEQVARHTPEAVRQCPIDPLLGLCDYQVRDVIAAAELDAGLSTPSGSTLKDEMTILVYNLWRLYRDVDATLVEVNPLALTRQGELICLDSKVTLDDGALFRHPGFDRAEADDQREAKARSAGLAYVSLDGDVGVIGNGAGLVMSILDQIAAEGGAAANFCDLGGGAQADVVIAALDTVLSLDRVGALLVSIFGGITRCDEVARGLVEAFSRRHVEIPVVVRLDGNAAVAGRAILTGAQLDGLTVAGSAAEAVRMVVASAREGSVVAMREEG